MLKPTLGNPDKPQSRFMKSELVAFSASGNTNVDKEKGTISNVILCQVGPAKGHGVHLEQEFIEDGIAYARKHWSEVGLKSRFGHPNMSNDALGTECGRFKNFRVEGDKMVADLHLYDSANLSPTHPGMKDWLLSMAEEDPNAIMCSIVFKASHYYIKGADGEKLKLRYNERRDCYETEKGDKVRKEDKLYVAMGEFMATDIVDEGAATEKLFSSIINKDKFAVVATEFFDQNPEFFQFLKENPEKVPGFTQLYDSYKQKQSTNKPKMKKYNLSMAAVLAVLGFSGKKEEELPEVTEEHLSTINTELASKTSELETANTELGVLKQEKLQWAADKAALETKLATAEKQANANLELAEQYRVASGNAFSSATQTTTDPIVEPAKDEYNFSDFDHNRQALADIANL